MKNINPQYSAQQIRAEVSKGIRSVLRDDTPPEAIDLIEQLLEFEPQKRITAEQAL